MVYLLSGCVIIGTHYLLKENQWLIRRKLWQLIFSANLVVGVSVVFSTWIGSLIPVIIATVICGTMLQIKYLHQIATQRVG